jgi:serine/threonine-protein kinase RsbT
MTRLAENVLELLAGHMPRILAQSVLRRALTSLGVDEKDLRAEHLPALRRQLEAGVRLFVAGEAQRQVMGKLDTICSGIAVPAAEAERLPIVSEEDVSAARRRARDLAVQLGGSEFVAQRAATAASELARNILAYAREGLIELLPRPERGVLTIRAQDQGPGIADVQAVLAGRYRSRTGLGMGLRGVQRLAQKFDISTGPKGTLVEADLGV